jgi:hypothetical protein
MGAFDDLVPGAPAAAEPQKPAANAFSDLIPAQPSMLESFGRGAAEGATFGFDDKLGMSKEKREASRSANPWAHFMGEIAGGAAPMVASYLLPNPVTTPAAVARTGQLGYRALQALGLLKSALVPGEIGTFGQAAKQGTKLGLTYGTASGAGHADVKPEDSWADALAKRATGAAKGAAEGAVVGPVLGVAGHGVFRAGQGLGTVLKRAGEEVDDTGKGALVTAVRGLEKDRITPQELIDNIRAEFPDATQTAPGAPGQPLARRFWGGLQNKQPITADQVDDTVRLAMLDKSPAEISAYLAAKNGGTGPGEAAVKTLLDELAERHLGPLNLVDRASMVRRGAGDNTQMSMRAAAATPGEHLGIARENLLERQIGAGSRLAQLLDRTLGSSNYEAVAARHADDLQSAGTRAYNTAFANEKPFDLNPIFNKWEAKFGNMAGPIPKAVMSALDDLRTTQPVLDAAGNVVKNTGLVNQAPPMSLEGFIFARQGLSDAIEQAKNAGNKNLARQLTQLHQDISGEVARTNPAWAEANAIWRDGKAAQDAMEAGARMTTRLNAANRENLAEFTSAQADARSAQKALAAASKPYKAAVDNGMQPSPQVQAAYDSAQARLDAANARQQLFKVGVVRALSDMIANQGETHNLTRQLLLPGAQKMLRQVLGPDADQFFKAVQAEGAMHRTYQSQFGSQTTPLREAIDEQNWAPRTIASWYNPFQWHHKLADLVTEHAARTLNANRNKQLMGLYTETDPLKQLDALKRMQALHAARSTAGNLVGKPVVGLGGPLADATLGAQAANEPRPAPVPMPAPYRP